MGRIKQLALFITIVLRVTNANAECGYKSCHPIKEDQINIHLVPHSHDDLGWLKTFEQYYYGSHDNIQRAGVRYILESVVDALRRDSDRRFIYVETGFFWKWWLQQDETMKNQVKDLVNNGQLEFISGGWSMNDEAGTYYQNTIDQLTWGLRKLNETFGECGRPRVAWQIDAFGHSREMASIFAQLGFDGFFLNRIDYQDLQLRRENRQMEFVWRGSPDHLRESTDIYTNILYRSYSAPGGLCFDVLCNDEPIIDDQNSPEYNVEQKVTDFLNSWVNDATKSFVSNNILVPMGDDFQYMNAAKNFINIDKLIKYMNGREFNGVKYNVIYSTPSCYLNAVYHSTNGTLEAPLKTDDFFPFAYGEHNYFTGYFTSRPTGKGYDRYSNNFLQICKQLSAITNLTSAENTANLDSLREALGVFQHHDAITGTERENVAHDYIRLLHNGITNCEEITDEALSNLTGSENISFTTCPMLNISECARTENEDSLVITVYNPLGKSVNKYVRLPVVDNVTEVIITDPSGKHLVTQIVPIHPSVIKVPGRNSSAQFDLIFRAENIPALGFKSFFYQRNPLSSRFTIEDVTDENIIPLKITQSEKGTVLAKRNSQGLGLSVGTAYYYYTGFVGNSSSSEFNPSDPYVFRPDPKIPIQPVSKSYDFVTYYGPLVTETHWYFTEWLSYVRRSFSGSKLSEFNHLVGPLPFHDQGIEVVVKFSTTFEYDDKIFTDTNGRENIQRVRNYRPTWNLTVNEPEAGNYYPIVSGISLKNGTRAGFAVINDRAQGGGSMSYQSIEFMIHRNTINGGAAGEPLNEQAFGTGVVSRGSHYLMFTGTDHSQFKDPTPKEVAQQVRLDSWIFFASPNGLPFEEYKKSHIMEYSGLTNTSLPRNVHILTLEPWGPSTVLLRLENFIGKDDTWHSGTSTVNVQDLFSAFKVISMKETTLGANQWLEENSRMKFNRASTEKRRKFLNKGDFNVTLDPMEIRTFVLTISY